MTRLLTSRARTPAQALLAALLLVAVPGALTAQVAAPSEPTTRVASVDPRWQGFVGCWRPAPPPADSMALGMSLIDASAPLLCIVLADQQSVQMITVADGKAVASEMVDASGTEWTRSRDGCTGVESAQWASDGQRVYLRSEYTCPGGIKRTSNGVLAISTSGELLDVQGVISGAGKSVRVARYRDAGSPSSLPDAVADAIAGRAMAVGASRAAAGAPVTEAAIVEASRTLDAPVVQAWMIERGQQFAVDAKTLVRLAKAGVPGAVTDVMVALAYPRVFSVNRATYAGDVKTLAQDRATGRTIYADVYPPNVGGYWNGYRSSYYGYSPFGYSRYGYGYNGFGSYYFPSGYANTPVIIVRETTGARHGKVVNGRGYTRNDPPSTSSGGTRGAQPSTSSSGSSGSSSPSSSSGSSGSSSGSSSSSGGERHAKPRP